MYIVCCVFIAAVVCDTDACGISGWKRVSREALTTSESFRKALRNVETSEFVLS